MSINMFIGLVTVLSPVVSLLTEAVKKSLDRENVTYSSNLIALIDSVIVGCAGTAACYFDCGIEWTLGNIVCIPLVAVLVWVGAMIGYDKAVQMVEQIGKIGSVSE